MLANFFVMRSDTQLDPTRCKQTFSFIKKLF
jgi:hypothetical protein